MAAELSPAIFPSDRRDRIFGAAVLVSLLLHGLLLFSTTFMKQPARELAVPGPIVARLAAPRVETSVVQGEEPARRVETPPPEKKSPPAPSPPAPAKAKAEAKAAAKAAEAPPSPVQPTQQGAASQVTPQAPAAAASPPSPASSAPDTVAKADPAPPRAAPPPAANAPSADDTGTIERYRLDVIKQASRYKTNPRVPGMRDIKEATAVVRMVIGINGLIASISVQKSAGHEVLDKNSVETLRRAKPLVQIPSSLKGKEFAIDVPFIYQLQDEGA